MKSFKPVNRSGRFATPSDAARLARAVPVLCGLLIASTAVPAHAYIGPGVGVGVIGTIFGIVATIALAIFGFLWYPMKRLFAKRRAASQAKGAPTEAVPAEAMPTQAATQATATQAVPAQAVPNQAVPAEAGAVPGASPAADARPASGGPVRRDSLSDDA